MPRDAPPDATDPRRARGSARRDAATMPRRAECRFCQTRGAGESCHDRGAAGRPRGHCHTGSGDNVINNGQSRRWGRKIAVMESAPADMLTGRMLDRRYHVRSRIAHGGMATVYLATDTRLDREVALKVMHADLARDADFVARFIGEAKSVARLSHPNIVGVYDQGADGQYLYLVDGVRARADAARAAARAGLAALEEALERHRPGARRARRRAPGRDRAPGRQAGERADHRRRAGQGRGLRAGPGAGGRREHAGRA